MEVLLYCLQIQIPIQMRQLFHPSLGFRLYNWIELVNNHQIQSTLSLLMILLVVPTKFVYDTPAVAFQCVDTNLTPLEILKSKICKMTLLF